jgi:hypothetical protein
VVNNIVLRRYRLVLGLFIAGLILSGITAFPLRLETEWLPRLLGIGDETPATATNTFARWLLTVRDGLGDTYSRYSWVAYGTDWLAFGHLVIALFFIGPWRDPVRNAWVLRVGVVACAGVIPLALIAGAMRGIPVGWRLIDCSFGLFGVLPLWYCLRLSRQLATPDSLNRPAATDVP